MKGNLRSRVLKGSIIIIYFLGIEPGDNPYGTVGAIPPPPGYQRVSVEKDPFAGWLRQIPLKRDRTVYLFDGSPKFNQDAQFAVLDISVGRRDLQQCADAVMRLRAEFLYSRHDYSSIEFRTQQGIRLNFGEWAKGGRVRLSGQRLVSYALPDSHYYCDTRACFSQYLETVFSYCGTLSLQQQLKPVPRFGQIWPGDVLIKGGAPGHAMLVMDRAEDGQGHAVFLLAQSYMPAQDIHIVKNPSNGGLSPWYRVDPAGTVIVTPEWTFYTHELRQWPEKN